MATSDCFGGWISCLQLLHAFAIPIMRLRWNHRQSFWSCLTQTASVSAAVVPSRAKRWHTQTQKHQQSAINRPLFKSQDALCIDVGTVAVNCFAAVCTWNQSLLYCKRSTVCIAQQKHDRTQNNISHIGLTSMVLCHGVQKLEQNGWFRPESFRSPRPAIPLEVLWFHSILPGPSLPIGTECWSRFHLPSYTKPFTAQKLLDRMVLTNVCIYLRMLQCS